ncbi:MAG: ABC transporter permease [Deltaproteobacteria bacterium]|nr:ABC transporter permease [Deltaproteobacteria bacterium]
MIRYLLRRVANAALLLLCVSAITFVLLDLAPGDPAAMLLGQDYTEAGHAQLSAELGLDKPLHVRYTRFLTGALHGDFGKSFETGRPVVQELRSVLPATLSLALASILVAVAIGVPIGVTSAVRQNSYLDKGIRFIVMIAVSLPIFWLGLMMIYLFSVVLNLLPAFGRDGWRSLILPAATMSCYSLAIIVRMTRSSMLEVLRQDYITTARAKGLPEPMVIYKHALRNALLPVVTIIGLQFGVLLGGAVITETIFAWPGLGRLLVQGIFARDYPVIRMGILVIAGFFIVINMLTDVMYGLINPTVSLGRRARAR